MSKKDKGFINSESLTKWVRWLLYGQIIVAVISLISTNMEYQLLSAYEKGIYASQEQAAAAGEANDVRQGIVGMVYIAVFIISGIMILKWIYRANYNARQLGAKNMKFTSGWSIGWYFIPVAAWWKPYQAMKEICKASSNPDSWNDVKPTSALPWWWFFWLVNMFFGKVINAISSRAEGIIELKVANILYQVSDVLSIILVIVTMSLINSIYQAQISHANKQGRL